jgi:hypothetical protein
MAGSDEESAFICDGANSVRPMATTNPIAVTITISINSGFTVMII